MKSVYIQNIGTTKTVFQNNKKKHTNEIKWDSNYDGEKANISLDMKDNGKSKHYEMQLDNNDLEQLLGYQTVNIPLDKRLERDFADDTDDDYYSEMILPSNYNAKVKRRKHRNTKSKIQTKKFLKHRRKYPKHKTRRRTKKYHANNYSNYIDNVRFRNPLIGVF